MGLRDVWMLLSPTACVRASLLEQFLYEADMWEWGGREHFTWLKHELLLICHLAQTCKGFSVVYRGNLRNIAMDWLHMYLAGRPHNCYLRHCPARRVRMVAIRTSFPDYHAVLKRRDNPSQDPEIAEASSVYLYTSGSESDTEPEVFPSDSSGAGSHWDGDRDYYWDFVE